MISAAGFAAKTRKPVAAGKPKEKVKPVASPVGVPTSLLGRLHKARLAFWAEESKDRVARGKPALPEAVPEDVASKPELWPSPKYVTGLYAYRVDALDRNEHPTYFQIVRGKTRRGTPAYAGISTSNGITKPTQSLIAADRKDDWRVLPAGQVPDYAFWTQAKADLAAKRASCVPKKAAEAAAEAPAPQ